MNAGIAYAVFAYVLWGVFPVYFKALHDVPAAEILAHRMVWSLVFVAAVLALRRRWDWLADVFARPALVGRFVATAALVTVNWGVYIWAVNAGRVVDASLGYFINPLVNVAIGAIVLHERLRPAQWIAVALAATGVAWLTWHAGALPWIGLTLAFSFAAYGLLRKTASLGAAEGLALETALLAPLALAYLGWLGAADRSAFGDGSAATRWLLAAAGPVTALPLLAFAAGARRIPFSMLGLLQYIAPTLQLLLGVWLYREPFEPGKALGFAAIWVALAIYSIEGLWQTWRRTPPSTRAP
ncbi:MAG: EamA family transporter RarD [Burkholderiaceae bacterium]|nr:EamA family transporter RarD [Burkholderiaceae bacterium]